MTNSKRGIPTVNLFGEDGISIYVTYYQYSEHGYVPCSEYDPERNLRIVGHSIYACSIEQTRRLIFDAWVAAGMPTTQAEIAEAIEAQTCDECGSSRATVLRSGEDMGIADPICCETVLPIE